jgi:hypothetical protein
MLFRAVACLPGSGPAGKGAAASSLRSPAARIEAYHDLGRASTPLLRGTQIFVNRGPATLSVVERVTAQRLSK